MATLLKEIRRELIRQKIGGVSFRKKFIFTLQNGAIGKLADVHLMLLFRARQFFHKASIL
jgi:hypothetical protein